LRCYAIILFTPYDIYIKNIITTANFFEGAGVLSDLELANKLSKMTGENITYAMVRRQRRNLGISKPKGRKRKPENNTAEI
jgi:hypothetical protein